MENYYEILGVKKEASEDEIKAQYRKLAKEHHPDTNPDDKASEERFKKITEAYSVLSDKEQRSGYDYEQVHGKDPLKGHNPFGRGNPFGGGGPFGFDPGDPFSSFFGGRPQPQQRKKTDPHKGRSIRSNLRIPLEFAMTGKSIEVDITRDELCSDCSGSGKGKSSKETVCNMCGGQGAVRSGNGFFVVNTMCPKCQGAGSFLENPCPKCKGNKTVTKNKKIQIKIPAGIDDGMGLTLSEEGNAGLNGGKNGDINIVIEVGRDERFERKGHDLYCKIPINVFQAMIGDEIEITNLDNKKIKVFVKPMTQNNSTVRLSGQGFPTVGQDNMRGDLYITFEVRLPENISKDEYDVFKQFKDGHKNDVKSDFIPL